MSYDAIIVGARCAGSPLAMLLARRGHRVLLVDRAKFPSDTLSAHTIQPAGVARLARWGLLDLVRSAGAPFIDTLRFDLGDVVLEGTPVPVDGITSLTAPRRQILDNLLVDAAREAGVEVRTGFSVRDLIVENGRVVGINGHDETGECEARAQIVVGADGKNSFVARAVGATTYNEVEATNIGVYTYYKGVECSAAELYPRPNRFSVVVPTNDDTVVISQQFAIHEAATVRADVTAAFDDALSALPDLAARVAAGERTERFRLTAETGGFLRVPYGPGWALVGDAGYHKDPITAQGMLDAFRDAELLAEAITAGIGGDLEAALNHYHLTRDAAIGDIYEFTCGLARLHEPPPPHVLALFGALEGNSAQIARFFGIIAGSVRVSDFFAPSSIEAILGAPVAA
jgi:flavin-dependent dehydrogenase